MQVFEEKYDKLYAGKYAQNWAKLMLTKSNSITVTLALLNKRDKFE